MRNSSGHQCKVKLSGSEKKWTGTRTTFPSWNVQLRTFWKFHSVVVQNNGKEMYKKSVLLVQSCFCNLGLLVFFTVFQRCIPSLLSITPLYSGTPRAECASGASWVNKSTYPRKFGNHVTDRPSDRPSVRTTGIPMFTLTLSNPFGSPGERWVHINVVINFQLSKQVNRWPV